MKLNIFPKNKTKVLCLDGGGVKGIYEAKLLELISKEFKLNLSEYFDYFVGTSAGAIVAAATVLNLNTQDVLDQFMNMKQGLIKDDLLRGIYKTRYKAEGLAKTILEKAGDKTFGDLDKKLYITAVNLQTGKGRIFGAKNDGKNIKIADAVIASASAPIFFPPHKIKGIYYADGGMWASNPAMIALMQLLKDGKKLNELSILSIGTGFTNKKATLFEKEPDIDLRKSKIKDWGLLRWNLKLFNLMIKLQADKADYIADTLLAAKDYIRLDFSSDEQIDLDSVKHIPYLILKAEETFNLEYNSIKQFFGVR